MSMIVRCHQMDGWLLVVGFAPAKRFLQSQILCYKIP